MSDRAAEVEAFKQRVFSGMDLLMLMESVGVGVGATMHEVDTHEIRRKNRPETYRTFDFDSDITVDEVKEALAR